MRPPLLVHLADESHGVDRCARTVAGAVARLSPATELRRGDAADLDAGAAGATAFLGGGLPRDARVHVHVTDRLWGPDPERSAARIEALAAVCDLGVTLHDLPQASDGPTRLPRRLAFYRRVVAAASVVVVNSEHERHLLRDAVGGGEGAGVAQAAQVAHVVPLPVPAPRSPGGTDPADRPAPDGAVAVLGFFYPGKGHREVVDAVARLPRGAARRVTALGRASAGHEGELAELVAHAVELGVDLRVTGFLSDDDLATRARTAAVPVIAHQHVSASGSLTDWLAAGRRPLVLDSPYFREMARLRPGTLTLVAADALPDAIAGALDDPASTWQESGASTRPDLDDVARAYLDLWASRGPGERA
ncbi:hypothetical protein [Litorihabitans aurantiacus]|uniref:Uncharacterized protein n=1 Tax=Litorihabitans aurantiacus TaxID=1930061 RepID=A0AA37XE41_9MICO|nr:hypothetical protein [Litorihabitans aurantiacus]GMA31518.1 hypothetical protein GCM10025875_15100 [Litorihabitans aurantiacus]